MLAGGLYERTSGAAGQPLGSYQRRAPERTVLHELVARLAQSLRAELRDADPDGGGLPRYVERELAAYLRRGVLAHGFTHEVAKVGTAPNRERAQIEWLFTVDRARDQLAYPRPKSLARRGIRAAA